MSCTYRPQDLDPAGVQLVYHVRQARQAARQRCNHVKLVPVVDPYVGVCSMLVWRAATANICWPSCWAPNKGPNSKQMACKAPQ